jgi:hypothetical protein
MLPSGFAHSKIEKFINLSFDEKAAMGKAGREKIERDFDRKIVVNRYCDEVAKA